MGRATLRILPLAAVLVAGCATAGNPFPREGEAREIEIEVLNLNFSDATLYALRVGQRIRLGIVTGKESTTFTIEWPVSFDMQIEIRLLGGDRCITREMPVDPGDRLYLEIPQNLATAAVCVRR